MRLKFTEMQGAGNDFVVLDGVSRRVPTCGGDLTIRREGADNPVWMTGPAVTVFEGEIEIDES